MKAQCCTIHQYSCTTLRHCSAPFISTVLHHSSVQLHHSSVLFGTIRHHSFAPFVSSVLHHLLATILRHFLMLFYNSASSNNLATDANTHCRLFKCIVEILVLATAAFRTFRPTCRRIYSTVEIQLRYTSIKSLFSGASAELLVYSVYY